MNAPRLYMPGSFSLVVRSRMMAIDHCSSFGHTMVETNSSCSDVFTSADCGPVTPPGSGGLISTGAQPEQKMSRLMMASGSLPWTFGGAGGGARRLAKSFDESSPPDKYAPSMKCAAARPANAAQM